MKRVVFCWLWMTCLVLGLTGCETTHVVPVEGLIPNRGELESIWMPLEEWEELFGTDLETRSYLINSKGQALELLGEDFLKRYPDYSSVDYTRYSLILTWCWYPISELDKASGYAVEDGPSGIKVKSYFNFSQGHFSEDMYGGVFAFFVDRLLDETEVGFSVNYGVYE